MTNLLRLKQQRALAKERMTAEVQLQAALSDAWTTDQNDLKKYQAWETQKAITTRAILDYEAANTAYLEAARQAKGL